MPATTRSQISSSARGWATLNRQALPFTSMRNTDQVRPIQADDAFSMSVSAACDRGAIASRQERKGEALVKAEPFIEGAHTFRGGLDVIRVAVKRSGRDAPLSR